MRLIDADALFDEVFLVWGTGTGETEGNLFLQMINEAPTINQESLRACGRWRRVGEDEWDKTCKCSKCEEMSFINTAYCPNCGAKMEGYTND